MLDLFLFGLLPLPVWGYVVLALVLTHLTVVSVTVFLHRSQAHRAVELHPLVSHPMRFWLWLTTGMVTREWVAVHRKHHARTETPEDPHSPKVEGLARVVFGGVGLYRRAASDSGTLDRYGRGTPDDALERHLYSKRPLAGLLLMLAIDLVLFGLVGLLIWGVQMIWIPFWAAGIINGLGHALGYRNFETRDASTNILPIGLLVGGEELHNNHHARPGSPKLSARWWEFDIAWLYLSLLSAVGLARPKNLGSAQQRTQKREQRVATVLSPEDASERYVRDVMIPWLAAEIRRSERSMRRKLREYRAWLGRPGRSPVEAERKFPGDEAAGGSLATLLGYWDGLATAYRGFASGSAESRHEIERWLRRAARSGIAPLEEFARTLEIELAMGYA